MYAEEVLSPYAIPQDLKETKGTRVGLFYFDGAQHLGVGVEFWANPTFTGLPGKTQDVPPNAWQIVTNILSET